MESGVQKHETGGDEDLGVVSLQVVLQAMGLAQRGIGR